MSSKELANLTSVTISSRRFEAIKEEIRTLRQLQSHIFTDINAQRKSEVKKERDSLLEKVLSGIDATDTLIPTGDEMAREERKQLLKDLQSSQMKAQIDLKSMLEQLYQSLKPDAYDTQIYEAVRGNDEIIVGDLRTQYASNPRDSPVLVQIELARQELHKLDESLNAVRELNSKYYRLDKAENRIEEFKVELPSRKRSKRTKIMFAGTVIVTLGLMIGLIVTQVH
ncbi:hypothetical protein K493DRAFT_362901 [Basidiobolus meristosporus CBS 931.73]|uniref:Uncharacterized protein n=1 Tax=Basidiobolus meristosporus CBS 931.73 TaxID=1314790 RepID=A0A1Y1WYH0_9FUNG|nr:hypothetical protein K493DRAFT_362901 [Basidiobolus meristosporus CBS 931.73]|eukprot:ORX78553.1 hypothetical protein K493DRAFT_362901 [Basidiobolus meristosporus CBS 931.73]